MPRHDLHLLAGLLADLDRVLNPLPPDGPTRFTVEPVIPPALPRGSAGGNAGAAGEDHASSRRHGSQPAPPLARSHAMFPPPAGPIPRDDVPRWVKVDTTVRADPLPASLPAGSPPRLPPNAPSETAPLMRGSTSIRPASAQDAAVARRAPSLPRLPAPRTVRRADAHTPAARASAREPSDRRLTAMPARRTVTLPDPSREPPPMPARPPGTKAPAATPSRLAPATPAGHRFPRPSGVLPSVQRHLAPEVRKTRPAANRLQRRTLHPPVPPSEHPPTDEAILPPTAPRDEVTSAPSSPPSPTTAAAGKPNAPRTGSLPRAQPSVPIPPVLPTTHQRRTSPAPEPERARARSNAPPAEPRAEPISYLDTSSPPDDAAAEDPWDEPTALEPPRRWIAMGNRYVEIASDSNGDGSRRGRRSEALIRRFQDRARWRLR